MPTPERRGRPTRGFLFADLRGYTAFVERHGAHHAAAMLDRYRTLVRAAVAEFDGAEIRTEGDSFYVVFDSASAAIECGLAIVTRAEDAAAEDPSKAFKVGIGVHAGETVETAEGYVGSAVNTAARICAQAGPNQVLVSGTVRALIAGVADASFVPIGRRRLKGLAEPIELWRAVGGATAVPRRRLRGSPRLAAGLGAIGLVGVLAVLTVVVFRPDLGSAGDGAGGSSASAAEASVVGIGPSSAPSDEGALSGIDAPYPNAQEQRLLLLVERDAECERALARDAPAVWSRAAGATGAWVSETVQYQGSITCPVGRSVGPDTVWYWHIELGNTFGLPSKPVELVRNHAGRFGVFAGGEGCQASHRAVEEWTFGETSGLLLCHSSSDGDAILEWAYDEEFVLGRAVRTDGDMAALLGWWTDTARFPPPEVSASAAADAFPNSHEEELLALLPASAEDRCERAPQSDVPVLDHVVIAGIPARTYTERQPISTWGSIYCPLGGISAPDELWYWRVGAREEAAEFVAQHAPKVGAVSGSCDETDAAVERWSFGGGSGSLLCYTTETGDAILYWTSDQTALLGKAIRDDQDMDALLAWWRDEARFAP